MDDDKCFKLLEEKYPSLIEITFMHGKYFMELHLGELEDHAQSTITTEYVDLAGALTTEDMKKRNNTTRQC